MINIKKLHFWALAAALICIGGLATHFLQPTPLPKYMDQDVRAHYNVPVKSNYDKTECRLWIDYEPQRQMQTIRNQKMIPDFRMLAIVKHAILETSKYMIFFDYKDMGGSPGLYLMFADSCDQSLELGTEIAQQLVTRHPYITKAHTVRHTPDRDHYIVSNQ